jgi:hypothetical protein
MNAKFDSKDSNNSINNSTQAHAALSEAVESRLSNQIESVKRRVFNEFQGVLSANVQLLRLALFEADVLARQTGIPELVFPLLASEKAQSAARWQFRQQYLLRSNSAHALAA